MFRILIVVTAMLLSSCGVATMLHWRHDGGLIRLDGSRMQAMSEAHFMMAEYCSGKYTYTNTKVDGVAALNFLCDDRHKRLRL